MSSMKQRNLKMSERCTLGMGCDETGHCYASYHNRPEMCGRPLARQPVDGEPVAHQWRVLEDGLPTTMWQFEGHGDRPGWEAVAKRDPALYQIETRSLYASPAPDAVEKAETHPWDNGNLKPWVDKIVRRYTDGPSVGYLEANYRCRLTSGRIATLYAERAQPSDVAVFLAPPAGTAPVEVVEADSLLFRLAACMARLEGLETLPKPYDLYYAVKKEGEGTGWSYHCAGIGVSDIRDAVIALSAAPAKPF